MAMKFRVSENVRFSLIVSMVLRDSFVRCGSSSILSSTRTMSAASTAMSVPPAPIAMPTCAFLSAGASLMPSPTMQTFPPASWIRPMASIFP